jgi:capsid portal protein
MIEDDEDLEQQADKFLMFKLGSEEYGVPRQAWVPPFAKQSYPNLTKGITAG